MRANTASREIEVATGATASVVVNVVNNDQVIDGVTARLIGVPDEYVKVQPALLPLFPDASGQLTLTVAVPPGMEAGRHALTVEVVSHGAHSPTQYLDVDLMVAARPQLALAAKPKIVRGRRSGRFVLELSNPGNLKLQADLQATDANRALNFRFSRDSVSLEPGGRTPIVVTARAPRRMTGSEIDTNVSISVTGRRFDLPPDAVEPEDAEPIEDSAVVQFRQRPMISRGLMTALILAGIVGLWAGAFLIGIAKVFAKDPLTKSAPASFFSLTHVSQAGSVPVGYDAALAQPAGALPKNGQLPAGVGSQISGRVLAASDHQPVGRILVQAVRLHNGTQMVVSSAGTQSDGTYTLAGLFPMDYYLKFSAQGFRSVWYPAAPSIRGAQSVPTNAQSTATVNDVVISGEQASISGSVDPGDTLSRVITTITARPLVGGVGQQVTATATTNPQGKYTLHNLPAPGSYELTFTAKGYESTAIVDAVNGGEQRLEPVVILSAGQGQISGSVRDANGPIGAATVSTIVNGSPLTVITPTTGQVGGYVLDHLPTPGAYVITFSAPGHGTVTRIFDLGVGAKATKTGFDTTLVAGVGSVTGRVLDMKGRPLGNVTVTVGGASSAIAVTAPTTKTLTGGATGTFVINGLPAPGSYTLTAQMDGYLPATVPFNLSDGSTAQTVTIHLSQGVGSLKGRVTGPCPQKYCAGATVTATNGSAVWTTAVSGPSAELPNGGYLFTGLTPGTYSVTVSAAGMKQQTSIVTIRAEQMTIQPLKLGP